MAWVEKVKGVLQDMLDDGWEPFEVTKKGVTKQYAGNAPEKKEVNGQMVYVFSDSGKAPTYSQALSYASKVLGSHEAVASSASSVVSVSSTEDTTEAPAKKRGGRPKGSKNKPKAAEAPVPAPAPAPAPSSDAEAESESVSSGESKKKAGRPKMTEEQKAAAKAARDAKMAAMTPEELRLMQEAKEAKKASRTGKKSTDGDASE
jgi:hypothetical protein